MKHLQKLSPGARNAVAALIIIAALYPAPINLAARHIAAIGLTIAAILLLRIHPAGSHKTLTAVRIPGGIASAVTGHQQPTPKPQPGPKHAPVTGPQVPVTNLTR